MAREQAEYDALQSELRQEAEILVIDVKKAELLSQKVLATHSVRMKVALSELVVQTAEDLRSDGVRPKDRALALASLRAVCDRLYGWDKEPNVAELERAKGYAINLKLIATPPEKLTEMHREKLAREGGSSETVHKDLDDGPLSTPHKESLAAEGGLPGPTSSSEQPGLPPRPRWEQILRRVQQTNQGNPPLAATPPPQSGSPPLSPQERRKQELEYLARLRAEWRGQRR
jgi:hypothetical protein